MKGKVFSLKIILTLILVLAAGFCFAVTTSVNEQRFNKKVIESTAVYLGEKGKEQKYSALFGGDIIFSAEKVKVNSDKASSPLVDEADDNIHTFIGAADAMNPALNTTYVFQDMKNGTDNKTVIDNGEFVRLDNVYNNNQYQLGDNSSLQEAIMISFGSYVYNATSQRVEIATGNSIYSGVTLLYVSATKDGKAIEIPNVREITPNGGGYRYDFAYLIKQSETNEGHYQFNFTYMVNGLENTASFEFYIVNNTSYTQTLKSSFGYNAKPTMGWINSHSDSEFEKNNIIDGYVRYDIGKNGIIKTHSVHDQLSYPTITYDYTKYKLTYVHTANQRNTTHELSCNINQNLGSKQASLTWQSTSKSGVVTKTYSLNDYSSESTINLVTIMLTEPGTYVFNYTYLYESIDGVLPQELDFKTDEIKLSVHGRSAYYSKTDFEGAKMQYFEIATAAKNNIDLIIPNGFELNEDLSHLTNQELGFVYSLVENKDVREGNILTENSQNSLLNGDLLTSNNTSNASFENDYNYLTGSTSVDIGGEITTIPNIENYDFKSDLENVLKNINYVKTNQASFWFDGNDIYTNNSFYFYSSTKLTAEDLFKEVDGKKVSSKNPLNATVPFNAKGYYLVFVEIDPYDEGEYWQVFGLQYTSSSVNITLRAVLDDKGTDSFEDDETKIIANGQYTNKTTRIYWEKPGVFDRKINSYYYSVINQNLTEDSIMLTTKNKLIANETVVDGKEYYVASLGYDVADNTFVKYVVKLESEGESSTHKIFTVDKQKITGIRPYLIQELISGGSVYYAYDKRDVVTNGITDGYVTLSWDDKNSGAQIYATYSQVMFTPISKDPQTITGTDGYEWITTNYGLGTPIHGKDLYRATSNINVSTDCMLRDQGIHIITLTDDAGNSCNYALIIDRTEGYFEINGVYYQNSSVIFGESVDFSVGKYKAFSLDVETDQSKQTAIDKFIIAAANNNLASLDGFVSGSANFSKLIQKVGENYYLTVENNSIVAYEDNRRVDTSITIDRYGDGRLNYVEDASTSYIRTIYLKSENNRYSTLLDTDRTYIKIEINKDNARGSVYYSSIPLESGSDLNTIGRLSLGSDREGFKGISKAGATSAKNVAFVWNMGTGNFEVEKVEYTYYTLKPGNYQDDDLYFYGSGETITIYNQGWPTGRSSLLADGRAYYNFNGESDSKAGLYVVTRTYKKVAGVDPDDDSIYGDDSAILKYYFIVDRNKIIDTGIGGSIKIIWPENQEGFSDFTKKNPPSENFDGSSRYNIYLETTKLPAIFNVPVGKYYDLLGHSSKVYSAGQLNVKLYFNDIYGQLNWSGSIYKNSLVPFPIFEAYGNNTSSDNFNINVYDHLSKLNETELLNRLTLGSSTNGTWMFLPGDYILEISDNVLDSDGEVNTLRIGMRINGFNDQGPQVDLFTGNDEETLNLIQVNSETNFKYSATVSQEFLKVVLPTYDKTETKYAQVDPSYIVIKQNGEDYVNHPYTAIGGVKLDEEQEGLVSFNDDGSINVWLDTKLYDEFGNIIYENLNKPLVYTIIVRYKLHQYSTPYPTSLKEGDFMGYKDCYVRYTANGKEYYYQSQYVITIDREAPSGNVNALSDSRNDILVADYLTYYQTNSMFENYAHPTNTNLYFTKQYAKYYQNGARNNEYIYAFNVNNETEFIKTDVSKVYVRNINLKAQGLTLPMLDVSSYQAPKEVGEFEGFGGLGLEHNNYYEIIEQDAAGNITQYVVFYTDTTEENTTKIEMPVSFSHPIDGLLNTRITFDGMYVEKTVIDNGVPTVVTECVDEVNVYDIDASGATIVEDSGQTNDVFFKFELLKNDGTTNVLWTMLTTKATDFENLTQVVVDKIKEIGPNKFILRITSRTKTIELKINLYDQSQLQSLVVERLYKDSNGNYHQDGNGYYIKLDAANRKDADDNLWYATKITITTTTENTSISSVYVGSIVNGLVVYEKQSEGEGLGDPNGNNMIYCNPLLTYRIEVESFFLEKPIKDRFNISAADYYVVEFEDIDDDDRADYYEAYLGTDVVYYGYTNVTFKYDKVSYTIVVEKNNGHGSFYDVTEIIEQDNSDSVYNALRFRAIYDEATGKGGVEEYRILMYIDGEHEKTIYLNIDSQTSNVALRNADGQQVSIKTYNNSTLDLADSAPAGNGVFNLIWDNLIENDHFKYTYTLYELLKDGTYRNGESGIDVTGSSLYTIAVKEDSAGIFKFVISVYGLDDNYLGNRIYSFEVSTDSSQVYYVKNYVRGQDDYESLKLNEIPTIAKQITDAKVGGEKIFADINRDINIPLYISNVDLIIESMNPLLYVVQSYVVKNNANYKFTMYKISKTNAFEIYLATLKITPTNTLVKDVAVNTNMVITQTSFTVAGENDIVLHAKLTTNNAGLSEDERFILSKNNMLLDIYYMDQKIETKVISDGSGNIDFVIEGSGLYSFEFRDLAGNVHEFPEDQDMFNPATVDRVEVYALREVVLTINNQAVVNNAYYSDIVNLAIYGSTRYVTGSVNITAKRNGQPYYPLGNNPYVFSDYGTYEVTVSAVYQTGLNNRVPLSKTIRFTIINPKEARESLDLTSLTGCEITSVVNQYGQDVTEAFVSMLNTGSSGAMKITYDKLMEHAIDLNVVSGKLTFTLTYRVEDKAYPTRDISITFTLNNEVSSIPCTLEKGETTTKGFTIYFNPAVIYEQIGEAYVYVGNNIVATINEASVNSEIRIDINYDTYGDGDYYVKLVNTSGVVLDSYKVTIKEPLNTWAIIVIVVVVGIVAAVVITVIVLRRRMRIR